jgi:hypothetical protein
MRMSFSQSRSATDLVFLTVTVLAGAIFWLAPRPPMSDLAQHAAQISLWRDLLLGTSKWQSLVYINYFTPYLIPYAVALGFSYFMSAAAALKLALTLSFYAFVYACIFLRREFGGDRRLDWLFLPAFFSHPYVWGFYTFLAAAPIGLLFMSLAHRYAGRPSVGRGVALLALDIALFFSHGLVFLFANAAGGAFLLLKRRRLVDFLVASWPYVLLVLLCALYSFLNLSGDKLSPDEPEWGFLTNVRVKFPLYALSAGFKADLIFIPVIALLFCTPFLLRSRLNRADYTAFVPLAITILIAVTVPTMAFTTAHLFQRFGLFLLPSFALIFRAADPAAEQRGRSLPFRQWALPVLCIGILGVKAGQAVLFARESADFDTVLAAAEPESRALMVILDGNSPATGSLVAYNNFGLWYQAEKKGFVDLNIAINLPMVVRYRRDMIPAVGRSPTWPHQFEWNRFEAWRYRYFFVRHTEPVPEAFFSVKQCHVILLQHVGTWSLYENTGC